MSIHSPEWDSNALYSFRIDKDVNSSREAMELYGGVSDFDSFAEAVNE